MIYFKSEHKNHFCVFSTFFICYSHIEFLRKNYSETAQSQQEHFEPLHLFFYDIKRNFTKKKIGKDNLQIITML